MKLIKLKMNNFRQYYGEVEIEFSEGDNNITLITGENGKGKTAIYRAIVFSLYGLKHIQQDNQKEDNKLVNRHILDTETQAEMSTSLVFEHNGKTYNIKRNMIGFKSNNKYVEQHKGVELSIIDSSGNYTGSRNNENEIRAIIDEILAVEIKDFFLFDGEKIDTLVKTDEAFKKEVQTAILKLMQIDSIDKAKEILTDLIRQEDRSLREKAKNNIIDEVYLKISKFEKELKEMESNLENEEKELSISTDMIDQFEMQLTRSDDIKELQLKIEGLQEVIKTEQEKYETHNINLTKQVFEKTHLFLMKNEYIKSNEYLLRMREDIRDSLPLELLDFSLEANYCVCCNNDLAIHEKNKKHIIDLRERLSKVTSNSFKNDLITHGKNEIEDAKESEEELRLSLRDMNDFHENIKNIELEIDSLTKDIGSTANKNMHHAEILESMKSQIEIKGSTKEKISSIRSDIENKSYDIKQLEQDYSNLVSQDEKIKKEEEMVNILRNASEHIIRISKDFNNEVRILLNEKTTKMFNELIDKKDEALIKEVVINEKFEIELIGKDGVEITQDISQGQRHMMSLSFILSLAVIASNDEQIEYPFFMDSPFNRLSRDNRLNLIKKVPNIGKQWILLLTDTELATDELNEFKNTNKVGNVYHIVQVQPFVAQIHKTSLDSPFMKGEIN